MNLKLQIDSREYMLSRERKKPYLINISLYNVWN